MTKLVTAAHESDMAHFGEILRRTGEQIDFPCIARGERGRLQEINVLRSGLHGVYE